jgi:hypothetical protein
MVAVMVMMTPETRQFAKVVAMVKMVASAVGGPEARLAEEDLALALSKEELH